MIKCFVILVLINVIVVCYVYTRDFIKLVLNVLQVLTKKPGLGKILALTIL